jgi:hypothetical protein
MQDFEGLGTFYLGRRTDPVGPAAAGMPLLYDSADLTTHGLCVGMTGSGKTGLGIALIEEAALDGIPVIVIDPKGDMGDLLLSFPELRPADFEPWINADDAARAGETAAEYAQSEARRWAEGLADWGQDRARIGRLRRAAEFALYTPGSTAGQPVSVLSTFAAPDVDDPELRTERAQTTVSSLLSLAGLDADPVKSREHILLSLLLLAAWQAGENPDLGTLIARIQQPPLERIGVMELDAFFPAKDRFAFAMTLNSLIAAPGFAVWMQGVPLDIGAMLRTPAGQPRVAIFSIAHLDDSQRMFFVALLLSAITGWMRSQSGTTSLRALVYMDEIFGFFPPVANPPSKPPLLTLLKQGRAFGLGVVLATQNPVDLDYKGLANIGTWWLGRLQTERDKARVLDGLDSVTGGGFDRSTVDGLLAGLKSRTFLMRNVHDKELCLFESRWAMSYLRGPLSREDIRRLTRAPQAVRPEPTIAQPTAAPAAAVPAPRPADPPAGPAAPALPAEASGVPPLLQPGIEQYFTAAPAGATLRPYLYAVAELRYTDARLKLGLAQTLQFVTALNTGPLPVEWEQARQVAFGVAGLLEQAPPGVQFATLPSAAGRRANWDRWGADLARWLKANQALELWCSPTTKLTGRPGESEADFRGRLAQLAREQRDAGLQDLREKYAGRHTALAERLHRAQQAQQRETQQAAGQGLQTAISVGATIFGALLGRKPLSARNLGRAATAARGAGRTLKETGDVGRARESVAAVQAQLNELEAELAAAGAQLTSPAAAAAEPLELLRLLPKRGNAAVKLLTLLWLPDGGNRTLPEETA